MVTYNNQGIILASREGQTHIFIPNHQPGHYREDSLGVVEGQSPKKATFIWFRDKGPISPTRRKV